MILFEKIKYILFADRFVSKYKTEEEERNQRGIALIAAAVFTVMSLLNVLQHSYVMLETTASSAVFLLIGYLISRYKKIGRFLRIIFYIIFVVIFTSYTIMGGNDGFATLWLVVATYAVMTAIDFKVGFLISIYYLIMLLMVFVGPLSGVLCYEYNKTFMLRFPFLYAANFAFATYIVIRIRLYQYELILKQQELEYLNTTDLSTGLRNRNYFLQQEGCFCCDKLESLAAVFIDVNGLHELNNREGHDAGDRMLCIIADLCRKFFGDHAIYRMGGDEFLILCIDVQEQDILSKTKQLVDAVEHKKYSISYGIEVQTSEFNLDQIVKDADARMIKYKKEYYGDANRKHR